ncbi:uncharacterized protein LOC110186353 [Drosophila serrata]|uniref:uncharacterized protein LOC110186353 n=1 Tax=Drosophila serrata TaxID=7274 RepID=UPI000A1D143D|nr:uncharacterized protein LOC110186353 [Drosophila serrata]
MSSILLLLLLLMAIGAEAASFWQLPKTEQVYQDLASCREATQGEEAATLRCLVKSLGLWTDEAGYQARRIAKIFAGHNQMEELMLVVNYCNRKEEQRTQPDEWALRAYRCATSGRFGHWVRDFMKPKEQDLK